MTPEEIRAFIRQYVDEWQRADWKALAARYTQDSEVHSPMFGDIRGHAAVESAWHDTFKAFADITVRIDDVFVDCETEDRAVLLSTFLGTHRGDIFGMPGT